MINKDWLAFIYKKDLNENYQIALTYKATENVQPIIHIKSKEEFDKISLELDKQKIEYDFITFNKIRTIEKFYKKIEKLKANK